MRFRHRVSMLSLAFSLLPTSRFRFQHVCPTCAARCTQPHAHMTLQFNIGLSALPSARLPRASSHMRMFTSQQACPLHPIPKSTQPRKLHATIPSRLPPLFMQDPIHTEGSSTGPLTPAQLRTAPPSPTPRTP